MELSVQRPIVELKKLNYFWKGSIKHFSKVSCLSQVLSVLQGRRIQVLRFMVVGTLDSRSFGRYSGSRF